MGKLFGVIKKAVSVKCDAFNVLICLFSVCCILPTILLGQVDTAWVRRYNGPGNGWDEASAIAVDGSGNVYVTGYSWGSGTSYDYATVKYNSQGVEQWVARYNGPGNSDDGARAIAVDGSGNVYVTGSSYGSGTYADYATIKYNSSGVEQWVARYNGPGNSYDCAYAIAVDGLGNVYVTGYSWGSGTSADYATIKYNSQGVEQWVARYNGPGNSWDEASAIAVDGSGNVYVTGYSYGSGTSADYATIKYNSSGVEQWVARYNGPGNGGDWASAIAVDG
ncbi:MAG: SBBP repeat-containing protein, partial [candidate division WOR-3 bacterium]